MSTKSSAPGRFSFLLSNYSYGLPSDQLFQRVIEIAQALESSVFDTMWLPDHLVQGAVGDVEANRRDVARTTDGPKGRTSPIFDAPTLLCALAVKTTTINLGPLVSPLTTRHPAILAKIMTTVDVVSGGRSILGLGAGWDAEEHRRYGLTFPPIRERQGRLEDAAQICRAMFDEVAPSFKGTHFSIEEAVNVPRPVSERIPILIGGVGPRTIRIAARYADVCNPIGDGETVKNAFELLERNLEEIGRDPAEVKKVSGVLFHRRQDLYRQVEDVFAAGSEGVVLVPWQQAFSPDELVSIGEDLDKRFS